MGKPWEQRKLGKLFSKSTEKGKDGIPILSVSIHFGVSSSELDDEDLGKFVRRSEDKSLYLKVDPGDIVLNMMRAWQGGIGVSRSIGMVSPAYIVAKPSIPFNSSFLNELIRSHKIIQKIDNLSYGVTDFRKRLYWESFSQINLQFPNLEEQKKIGNLIQEFDNLIDLEQHQLDLLKKQKRGLLQKMFPKDGSSVPEIRFPNFTTPWEQRKLSQIASRITRKNKDQAISRPLTISAQYGLIDQEDFFKKRIASKDLANYLVVNRGEFAYNKSYSEGYPWGTIKRLDFYENGVVSSLYIVFSIDKSQIDSNYLNTFFETDKWHLEIRKKAAEGARNHGLLNITSEDFFDMNIKLPSLLEQIEIGSFFLNIDNLITLHQRQLDLLKKKKKGLLQKMFPKEGADVPEVRFPEFK